MAAEGKWKGTMLRVLHDIESMYNIPRGTMRSAISRGVVDAEHRGKILMVDDEDPTFLAFKQTYHPRTGRTTTRTVQDGVVFARERAEALPHSRPV